MAEEAYVAFLDAGGSLWRRWRSLLRLRIQVALLLQRLRGRFKYGRLRTYAVISLARFLPSLGLISVVAFSALQVMEWRKMTTELNAIGLLDSPATLRHIVTDWVPGVLVQHDTQDHVALGEYYQKTFPDGSLINIAITLYETAAKHGSGRAASNLADIYAGGVGVQEDPVKSAYWRSRALGRATGEAEVILAAADPGPGETFDPEQVARLEDLGIEVAQPSIQLIEPPVITRGGATTFQVQQGETQRTLVGRVSAPAGFYALTVNGNPVTPNNHGLFSTSIQITSNTNLVRIVAVDQRGKSVTLPLTLTTSRQIQAATPALRIPDIDFGRYHALVIGNANYRHLPDLNHPTRDARALEKVLRKKFRFNVTLLLNADRYTILSELNSMRKVLADSDNLLIFYSGHAKVDDRNGRSHWLPVDAEQDVATKWISNVDISDYLNVIQAKHVLVIADSPFGGP